jgi:hypothetical protein
VDFAFHAIAGPLEKAFDGGIERRFWHGDQSAE